MKYRIIPLLLLPLFSNVMFAGITFSGNSDAVVRIETAAGTGLEGVYVIRNTQGVSVSISDVQAVKWSRFGSNGAAYAEEIGTASSIPLTQSDCGYIAENDGRTYYFWVVNYDKHVFTATNLSAGDSDCQRTSLAFSGNAAPIVYYSINGRSVELDRQLELSYTTLVYNADNHAFIQSDITRSLPSITSTLYVEAPLCDTRFVLAGDRFLKAWNENIAVESSMIPAIAVEVETTAEQDERNVSNEQTDAVTGLGGSAPCEITFSAAASDAASFYEWQIADNPDFDPIDDRYPQFELNYTFNNHGTKYVRFVATNAEGECEAIGSVYDVAIGASDIQCPNAFSPQSSPGVNDEWKVSYKSIVSFECHIFNRWGTEMTSFTDPASGWDGKYKGKYVPAGVYYYVIKARGADGRNYNLSGDINIINSKSNQYSESPAE